MREEQQKELQEKQKLNQERRKDDFDITTVLDSGREKRAFLTNNVVDEQAVPQGFINDPTKSSLSSQMLASRPLVPPGFAGAVNERTSNMIEVFVVTSTHVKVLLLTRRYC